MIRLPFPRILLALSLWALLLPSLHVPAPVGAQELPWLGKGQTRLDFAPRFWGWDTRFGSRIGPSGELIEEDELLSSDLAQDPLGSRTLPYLTDLEGHLRTALGEESYQVRLGASQAVIYQSHLTFPFHLEVGVNDWLTVGAMVPLVRTRTEMDFVLNGDSLNADVGVSPNISTPSVVGRFLADFGEVLLAPLEESPSNQTLLDAQAYLEALTLAYWHSSVFPVEGSAAAIQLQNRLDDLRTRLEGLGVAGVPTTLPLAEGYMTEEEFAPLMARPGGMEAAPLEDYTRPWTLGDIEIMASALLLQAGGSSEDSEEPSSLRYQVGAGALVRLGTGAQALHTRLLSQDPADGQMDIEGSVFGRAEYGERFGAWGHLRYGIQMEGPVDRRITDPDGVLPDRGVAAPLNWTPGNYLDLELNPWFNFTPEMTFGVRYHLWRKGEDSYALQPLDPEILALYDFPDPALLNLETEETLQEVGFSATYSTRAANRRGEARFPLMVRFTYFRPLTGSGGQTPRGSRIQVGLTLFRTLWGEMADSL